MTPAGLGLGKRVYPWKDVHLAYLEGQTVELRVTPRWVTWFGDRRLFIRGHQFLVPAAEIHWLIQHYLLSRPSVSGWTRCRPARTSCRGSWLDSFRGSSRG